MTRRSISAQARRLSPVASVAAVAGKGIRGDRHFDDDGAKPGQALTLIEASPARTPAPAATAPPCGNAARCGPSPHQATPTTGQALPPTQEPFVILLPTVHCVPNWTICAVPRGKRQSTVASAPSTAGDE